MSLTIENVNFGGEFSGYLAFPTLANGALPGVIVLQEAWGVDAHIEEVTRRIALAGYVALAPDVFARGGSRPEPFKGERLAEVKEFLNGLKPDQMADPAKRDAAIDTLPEPLRSRIRESLVKVFTSAADAAGNLPPVAAAAKYLRHERNETRGQKIASIGFCMGGGLSSMLAATDPELAGAIIFYGAGAPEDKIANITCPILGIYGALDARVNAGIAPFDAAMKKHGKSYEHHIYEGAAHAFFNDTRPSYNVAASRDAFVRSLAFLNKVL